LSCIEFLQDGHVFRAGKKYRIIVVAFDLVSPNWMSLTFGLFAGMSRNNAHTMVWSISIRLLTEKIVLVVWIELELNNQQEKLQRKEVLFFFI